MLFISISIQYSEVYIKFLSVYSIQPYHIIQFFNGTNLMPKSAYPLAGLKVNCCVMDEESRPGIDVKLK